MIVDLLGYVAMATGVVAALAISADISRIAAGSSLCVKGMKNWRAMMAFVCDLSKPQFGSCLTRLVSLRAGKDVAGAIDCLEGRIVPACGFDFAAQAANHSASVMLKRLRNQKHAGITTNSFNLRFP